MSGRQFPSATPLLIVLIWCRRAIQRLSSQIKRKHLLCINNYSCNFPTQILLVPRTLMLPLSSAYLILSFSSSDLENYGQ